jgi:hypothetical protein
MCRGLSLVCGLDGNLAGVVVGCGMLQAGEHANPSPVLTLILDCFVLHCTTQL